MISCSTHVRPVAMMTAIMMLGTLFVSGCQLPPSHQQQVDRRERNLDATVRSLEGLEDGRMEKMGHTLNHFEEQHQDDIANTQRNAGRIDKWIQDDFDNWNRSLPKHEQRFHDLMKGRPESAERVLPLILY